MQNLKFKTQLSVKIPCVDKPDSYPTTVSGKKRNFEHLFLHLGVNSSCFHSTQANWSASGQAKQLTVAWCNSIPTKAVYCAKGKALLITNTMTKASSKSRANCDAKFNAVHPRVQCFWLAQGKLGIDWRHSGFTHALSTGFQKGSQGSWDVIRLLVRVKWFAWKPVATKKQNQINSPRRPFDFFVRDRNVYNWSTGKSKPHLYP